MRSALVRHQRPGERRLAIDMISQLLDKQVLEQEEEDVYYFDRLLKSCGEARDLTRLKRVHSQICESEYSRNRYLSNLLVVMYRKCGGLEQARAVFETIEEPNIYSWNIILAGYARDGSLSEAEDMFERIPKRDMVSWTTMIRAYAQSGHLDAARRAFEKMPERDIVSWTAMLYAYFQHARLDEAQAIFNDAPSRDEVIWTAMLRAFAENGRLLETTRLFDVMPLRSVLAWTTMFLAYGKCGLLTSARSVFDRMPQQNVVSWNTMIGIYATNRRLREAMEIYEMMPQPNDLSSVCILIAFGQAGLVDRAKQWFAGLPSDHRDTAACSALLEVYARNGCMHDAERLFEKLQRQTGYCNIMIQGYAHEGQLGKARMLFKQMESKDDGTWHSMLAACLECEGLDGARQLFDQMPNRSIVSWNAMLLAYAPQGRFENARRLLQDMNLEGIVPNDVTFMGVLEAEVQGKRLREAWKCYRGMVTEYSITPILEHYATMVKLLVKAQQLQNAENLLESIPLRPVASMWRNLHDASKNAGDYARQYRAAAKVRELLEPKRSWRSYS